ncbi:acetyltransferase [Streptomyces sp. XM4193]|uniref:GNAT family N-acetyltransferase n=1 Tax=Streptomyces sp. XM4193 TaxID=2929782 RepID=UPI001FF8924F|nr:GNAT family N-acetyltransferase [Streptomyces sp. XM4193]MCK1798064.1 acetyltransferase [Streptomyces sp. XM4193]
MIEHRLELPDPWTARYTDGTPQNGARLSAWMNQDYLARTWKQDWPADRWTELLREHEERSDVGSFTVDHRGRPFAYIEVYEPATSVLADHGDWAKEDLGFHFAVVEPELLRRGLARDLMGDLCATLFAQYPGARLIAVEPDVANTAIARLFEYTGFALARTVQLPHKQAALMVLPREAHGRSRSTARTGPATAPDPR